MAMPSTEHSASTWPILAAGEPASIFITAGADKLVRVWDTTTDTRYMVLPMRPSGTEGWSEEKLAGLISKDMMIGVARVAGT